MDVLKKILLITLLSSLLSACGFHLRGRETNINKYQPLYFKSKHPYNAFGRILRNKLKTNGVKLADSQINAPVTLAILSEQQSSPMQTVGSSQQVREYTLYYTVTFQLEDKDGNSIYGPKTVTDRRNQIVQPSQVLSDSNETDELYNVMYKETAMDTLIAINSSDAINAIQAYYKNQQTIKIKENDTKKSAQNAAENKINADSKPKPIKAKETKKSINPDKITASDLPAKQEAAPVPAQKKPNTNETQDLK